jgi:hypothetical protein
MVTAPRVPPDGVDILEGVACRCTWVEIAEPLGIPADLALVVSEPGAITRLREAA